MSRSIKDLRIVIAYKNFAARSNVSHIGLGVAALNNVKMLQAVGIRAEVLPLVYDTDLRKFLNLQASVGDAPITHVIVSAPWIRTQMYAYLCATFPTIKFSVNCHSNVGFLQADSNGIRLLRENLALEAGVHNFQVCGNSQNFCRFIVHAYGAPCSYLPNMYYLDGTTNVRRPGWPETKGVLRLGLWGATRSQKNFITACGAGIEVARDVKTPTELWINTQRDDGPETKRIIRAAHMMVDNLPNVTLKEGGWNAWPTFKQLVAHMHCNVIMSYTESFNMCVADGISVGVPSSCSDAITWVDSSWHAKADDVFDIARVTMSLINDPTAPANGMRALKQHNRDGLHAWFRFLGVDNLMSGHSHPVHRLIDAGDINSY